MLLNSFLTQDVQFDRLSIEMGSSFANLKWLLLLAVAMGAVVLPAGAQRVVRSGRPLELSAPESDTVSSNVPSLMPKAPDLPDFSDIIHAPGGDFNAPVDDAPLPAPVGPAISPVEAARLKDLRDKSKNWTIMTLADIMGVPTPEEILGITKRDASGMPKKQSPVEKFFQRQEQQQNPRTNVVAADAFKQAPSFFGNQGLEWNPNLLNSPNGDLGTPAAMNLFMGYTAPNQNPTASPLRSPAPQTTTIPPEHPAPMDQPRSSPPSPSRIQTPGKFYPAPQTTPDPLLGKSPGPFIGVPSAPPVATIGMPARVAPLPGILGQTNASAAAPSWKPELPPWMSSAPQPGVIPQRKF